jgi:hypothetical protein
LFKQAYVGNAYVSAKIITDSAMQIAVVLRVNKLTDLRGDKTLVVEELEQVKAGVLIRK